MYLRRWSPVKYLMYLWLAILVWMFSRCDSAATMHLAPPPSHSRGSQGAPGGHSSSISSSSVSSSGRYLSDSSRATPSVSSRTHPTGEAHGDGLSGGAIPPRLPGARDGDVLVLGRQPPLLPLPLVATGRRPWAKKPGHDSDGFPAWGHRHGHVDTHRSPGEPSQLPSDQLHQMFAPPGFAPVVPPASVGGSHVTPAVPREAALSSITRLPGAAEAERSLQLHWAAQMRRKEERRRLHRRRWRMANSARSLVNRNRRDSALPGGGRSNQPSPGRPQRRNGPGGGGAGGPRRYCSARDPATLAFESPIVCEAKVKSMSDRRPIFAATFEILALHKMPPKGRPLRGLTVRLQFNLTTAKDCDIFRGKFRERGFVREELELGKVYFLFLKPNQRYTNFTILGQPIRKTKGAENGVLKGVNPNYGTRPTINFITPNVTRVEGKRVRLVCRVEGQPPPKVAWFKDKRLITRNATKYAQVHLKKRSELTIFNASTADSGEYECRAKNRYNNSSAFNSTHVKITLPKATIPPSHMRPCADSHRAEFCHNGGTCYSIVDLQELLCTCPKGFSGHRCESKDSDFHPVSLNKQQDCKSQQYAGRLYTECMDFFVMDSPAPGMYEYDDEEN